MSDGPPAPHTHVWVPVSLCFLQGGTGSSFGAYLYLACTCGAYTWKDATYVLPETL
jgi:hypothetical protein